VQEQTKMRLDVGSIVGSFPYQLRFGIDLGCLLEASTCRWWSLIWVCCFHFNSCRIASEQIDEQSHSPMGGTRERTDATGGTREKIERQKNCSHLS
jgi:hypothetical protein